MANYKQEFQNYKAFKADYKIDYLKIKIDGDSVYYDDDQIKVKKGEYISQSVKWINVGFEEKNTLGKALSIEFPYNFKFKNKMCSSIGSVLKAITYKEKEVQDLLLTYSGNDLITVDCGNKYKWQDTNRLYWYGVELIRNSKEYDDFLIELFFSAIKNPLYKNNLLATKSKYILNSNYQEDSYLNILTRFEFETIMNSLRDYLDK